MQKRDKMYRDLADGFAQIGKAFSAINDDVENPPAAKILAIQIADKMNLGDAELIELIGFLQYCSANKDFSMQKLAKELSGKDNNGQGSNGQDNNGQDNNGQDNNGQENNGQENNGQDNNGQDNNGEQEDSKISESPVEG